MKLQSTAAFLLSLPAFALAQVPVDADGNLIGSYESAADVMPLVEEDSTLLTSVELQDLVGPVANWSTRTVVLEGIPTLFPDDPEPEFVDINVFNVAAISLQENNHIVYVDLFTGTPFFDYSAGTVDQWPKNVSSALMYGGMWTIPTPDLDRTHDFVRARDGRPAGLARLVMRVVVSIVTLGLGMLWARGGRPALHDRITGTRLVIEDERLVVLADARS